MSEKFRVELLDKDGKNSNYLPGNQGTLFSKITRLERVEMKVEENLERFALPSRK